MDGPVSSRPPTLMAPGSTHVAKGSDPSGIPHFRLGGFLGDPPPSSTNRMTYISEWLDHCEEQRMHPEMVRDQFGKGGLDRAPSHACPRTTAARFQRSTPGLSSPPLLHGGSAALGRSSAGHELTAGLKPAPWYRDDRPIWLSTYPLRAPVRRVGPPVGGPGWTARTCRGWSGTRRKLATVLLGSPGFAAASV